MTGSTLSTLQAYLQLVFQPALMIAGMIAVILSGVSQYRDKKKANLEEATSTWRELAEARNAENVEISKEVDQLRIRNRVLWAIAISHLDLNKLPEDKG